jgi:alpha-D-xyloside xylohydrolase
MKFTDGAWLVAKGVTPQPMRRVSEHRVERGPHGPVLTALAVDRVGTDGIDRVEGTVLHLRLSSPMPDVVRVQARRHWPVDRPGTSFDLDYGLHADGVRVDESATAVTFTSGRLAVRLGLGAFGLAFGDGQTGAQITTTPPGGLMFADVAGRGGFLVQRLTLAVGECVYGLGERFGPLVKNGQTVVVRNEDGGTVSDQAYKSLPFYLTTGGYGLLVNSPHTVEFEVATERVSQVQFAVPGESVDYYLFLGPAPKDVLGKYTRLAGRPAVPPAWSFGLWLSTSFTTRYDERTMAEFVDGMASRDLPLSVVHFDCFWMRERHWCDFQWDPVAFPDAPGMLARLKGRGLRVCLWINPYVSQFSPLFAEGRANGYFLKAADGSVYQRTQWQPGMAFVDFTNPAAVAWYQGKLRKLLDMGVDCFKTDFGERIPDDAVYHDGADPAAMHNLYTYLYNKAVFALLVTFHGKGNAMVFARSATVGGQKFPVHWGGDCEATFPSMAEDLRGGLSFCLSGAAFWSHDIGGFGGTADAGLYKRWVAFGLMSTHSRLHGNDSYRVPWLFDEQSVDVMRVFAKLKNRLFPYLFAAAHDAHDHGWPVMRAMVLEFPDDPACHHLEHQYMLGRDILVAPVFRADSVAEYYLPAGRWTNLLSGVAVDGGRWVRETLDYDQMPLFVRGGAVLPMSDNEAAPAWTLADPLTLSVHALADGATSTARAVGTDGSATFTATRAGNTITLRGDGKATRVTVQLADGRQVWWEDVGRPVSITVEH